MFDKTSSFFHKINLNIYMTSPLKIVFAGTPEFSVPTLQALIASKYRILSVYTQPDRPAGRGQKLTPSPIKQLALKQGISVHQPLTLRDEQSTTILKNLAPDVMIVVAYGLILPKSILEIPRLGCINIHASLLPQWRGAAPIQRAILAGDKVTGISIMQMDEGLDTGAILAKKSCDISSIDTSQSLHDRLSQMGSELLIEVLDNLENINPELQNEKEASYAKKIEKKEAEINWQQSADEIEHAIRAFQPWPVAHTTLNGNLIRIWKAIALNEKSTQMPGTIMRSSKEGIDIATPQGVLRLLEIQLPGGRALKVNDLLNAKGDLFREGIILGAK
jgi:methionyl-tRNA formyltransferase